MSPFYSKRSTYPGNPYAAAKASHQTVLGAEEPCWPFRKEGSEQRVKNSTGDPYAEAKELQQRVAIIDDPFKPLCGLRTNGIPIIR